MWSAARGMAVEINTRALYRDSRRSDAALHRRQQASDAQGESKERPHRHRLRRAQSEGSRRRLRRRACRCSTNAKINEIVFPVGGRLARVALRATNEHLEATAKAQEPRATGQQHQRLEPRGTRTSGRTGTRSRRDCAKDAPRARGPKKRASSSARTTKTPVRKMRRPRVPRAVRPNPRRLLRRQKNKPFRLKTKALKKRLRKPRPLRRRSAVQRRQSPRPKRSARGKTCAERKRAAEKEPARKPAAKPVAPAAAAKAAPAKAAAVKAAPAKRRKTTGESSGRRQSAAREESRRR